MSVERYAGFEILVTPEDPRGVLEDVRRGLTATPREISPRFLYDDAGSRLFEEICELPEYYQTRTEDTILAAIADEIVQETGAEELIELGSGAATKTRGILSAMARRGALRRYVPFDVSEGIVQRVALELIDEYPGLRVHAVIGDFMKHLDGIPAGSHRLCIFLGGTLGNFKPDEAARFLSEVREQLGPGDHFLLGVDLHKETAILEAAYNDTRGVTAEFNRNVLRVLNRLLDGDFDPDGFEHHAAYNPEFHRIEMWLRSVRDQHVTLPGIDLELDLAAGEEIRTEISTKFDRARVDGLLEEAGFVPLRWDTDPRGLFALALAGIRES